MSPAFDVVSAIGIDPAEIPEVDLPRTPAADTSPKSTPVDTGAAGTRSADVLAAGTPAPGTPTGGIPAPVTTGEGTSADETALADDPDFHVEPQPEPEPDPAQALFTWAKEGHTGGRRLRRNWASTHGWQYDRADELLGQQWQRFTGAPGPAHDVLAGRFAGMPARVADIGNAWYMALYRTGTTDVTVEFCPDIELQHLVLRPGAGRPAPSSAAASNSAHASVPGSGTPGQAGTPAFGSETPGSGDATFFAPHALGGGAASTGTGAAAAMPAAGDETAAESSPSGFTADRSVATTTSGLPFAGSTVAPLTTSGDTIRIVAPLARLRADVPTGPVSAGTFASRGTHTAALPLTTYTTQSDHVFVDSVSGFDMYSDDPLSARLMVDARVATALERLRGAAAAIVIDPWLVLVKTTARPHPEQLLEVFDAMRMLVDAARVLPAVDNGGELDMSFADPTRPWSIDDFLIGVGPKLQEAAPLAEPDDAPDPNAAWNDRPDFLPRQDYLLPRRDLRGAPERKGSTLAEEPTVAENTGTLPAVGEDPEHTSAHSAVGRVVREDAGEEPTIFGDRPAGRHRRRDDA